MSSNKDVDTPSSERLIGRVKWFNNKAGYGFITVTDGSRSGSDIFVHHSAVDVENQQYKYLVQGEYVEFGLIKTTSGDHEWQASTVNGIKGGKLMCETRRDLKMARTAYKTNDTEPTEIKMPTQQRAPRDLTQKSQPRVRGEGPRDGEKKEWTLVKNRATDKPKRVTKATSRQGATVITIESK
jgi:CspA family cold shock protein